MNFKNLVNPINVIVALTFYFTAGINVSIAETSSDDTSTMMCMSNGHIDYSNGTFFFVSAPLEHVKSTLEKNLKKNDPDGYIWHEETAKLGTMEKHWIKISLDNNPAIRTALGEQLAHAASPGFDRAVSAKVITPTERAWFKQVLLNKTTFEKEDIESSDFFAQPLRRWAFKREYNAEKNIDFGIVMDVSPIMNRNPVTLIWFGGSKKVTTRTFELGISTVGGYGALAPHIQQHSNVVEYVNPQLERTINKLVKKLGILKPLEALVHVTPTTHNSSVNVLANLRYNNHPIQSVPIFYLPEDENKFRSRRGKNWQMLALPDGSMLISGAPESHRFLLQADKIQRIHTTPHLPGVGRLKLDPNGTIWGITRDVQTGSAVALSWKNVKEKAFAYPINDLVQYDLFDDWVVQPGKGPAFRVRDTFYSLSPKEGVFSKAIWNSEARRAALKSVQPPIPIVASSVVHFNDGLFWRADFSAFGTSPETADIVRSVKTTESGLTFGSLHSGWGLAKHQPLQSTGNNQAPRYRVIDLKTGAPRWDLNTSLETANHHLARTAHGRLLAITSANSAYIGIYDMFNGVMEEKIEVPEDFSVGRIAFSLSGKELWIYLINIHDVSRAIAVWSIPEALIDPSSADAIPDQVRCVNDRCI